MKDKNFYIGHTKDLEKRINEHNKGKVISTNHRKPFILVYYEACLDKNDAVHREKYLKTHYGKMFLGKRLNSYLTGQGKSKDSG